MTSGIDAENQDGNVNISNAALFQIPDKLLKVRNARGHLIGEGLDRHDLDASVNVALVAEDRNLMKICIT